MNDLVNKANFIEKDIKGMPILEQIRYAANLYQEMNEVRGEEMGDMNVFIKAQTNVECVWRCLAAEYKGSMVKELEKRVAETSYCSFAETLGNESPRSVLVAISEQYVAEIEFKWNTILRIRLYQYVKDRYGDKTMYEVVPRWKVIPEWLRDSAKFNRGHFEKDVDHENWIDILMGAAAELKEHSKDVVTMCNLSSNTDEEGNAKTVYKTWKTKGRIMSLTKEMPIAHMFHAKTGEQPSYENSPYVHGSNGTYVENVQPYWSLNIKIKRPSLEVAQPLKTNIDIHDYITKSLMPRLEWGRITEQRLEILNEILAGTDMELVTTDTTEAALYRNFLPVGFKTWGEYLDSIILPKI